MANTASSSTAYKYTCIHSLSTHTFTHTTNKHTYIYKWTVMHVLTYMLLWITIMKCYNITIPLCVGLTWHELQLADTWTDNIMSYSRIKVQNHKYSMHGLISYSLYYRNHTIKLQSQSYKISLFYHTFIIQ